MATRTSRNTAQSEAPLAIDARALAVASDIVAGKPVTCGEAHQAAGTDIAGFYVYLRAHGLKAAGTGWHIHSDPFITGPCRDLVQQAAAVYLASATKANERGYYRVLSSG